MGEPTIIFYCELCHEKVYAEGGPIDHYWGKHPAEIEEAIKRGRKHAKQLRLQKGQKDLYGEDVEQIRILRLRTKREYLEKPTEWRDLKDHYNYLFNPKWTHLQKYTQIPGGGAEYGPIFLIKARAIMASPAEYLKAGVLHTPEAIQLILEEI